VWEWFQKGGPTMWPLLLCSIIALAITVERAIFLKRARTDVKDFVRRINGALAENKIEDAVRLCEEHKGPVATVFKAGLKKFRRSREEIEKAIEDAGNLEVARMERGLMILNTVNKLAPLLGFFGTVTGMSNAFTAASVAGLGDPKVVAAGIAEALITTIAGLAIAMPGTFFQYLFIDTINKIVFEISESSIKFLDTMEELEEKIAQRAGRREMIGGEYLEI
jgi:biopolymer transport protein ExbB